MLGAEGGSFGIIRQRLSYHRVTDEIAGHASGFHIGRLKGEKRQDMIDPTRHLFGPAGPPSPNGGSHVMHCSDVGFLFHLARDTQGEVGAVDGDEHIRRGLDHRVGRLVNPSHEGAVLGQYLGQPHDAQLVHVKAAFQPLGHHLRPADAVEGHLWAKRF